MSGPSWGAGGPLVYGPVSTLAECLQHVAGCEDCRGRWPVVPGMLAMAWRTDGHVEFDVTATAGDQPGPIRLLPPITEPGDPRLSAEGRARFFQDSREDTPSDPTEITLSGAAFEEVRNAILAYIGEGCLGAIRSDARAEGEMLRTFRISPEDCGYYREDIARLLAEQP